MDSFHCGFVHAVAEISVAQGQDHGGSAQNKDDSVVNERLCEGILPAQKIRARQRQVEADLIQEPNSQQA